MPQSWSPAGSSKICRTRPPVPAAASMMQQRRAAGVRAGADRVVLVEVRRPARPPTRRRPSRPRRPARRARRSGAARPARPGGTARCGPAPGTPARCAVTGRRPVVQHGASLGSSRRVAQPLPLVEQAGVDLADQLAQPLDEVGQLLGLGVLGHGLAQRLVRVGQVAQHQALGAGQPVEADVLGEGHRPLVHVADHGLGRQLVVGDPRVAAAGRSRTRRRAAPPAASGR